MSDAHPAIEFVKLMFGPHPNGRVHIASLPNIPDPDGKTDGHINTRSEKTITNFIARHDRAGFGCFVCVNLIKDRARRAEETVTEIVCAHADIDFNKVEETPEEIERVITGLPWPPSRVNHSGHGLHLFWCLLTALAASPENKARHKKLLKQIANLLAGDLAVCDIPRLMRLPGTTNSKNGDQLPVRKLSDRADLRYEYTELERQVAGISTPLLHRKDNSAGPDNPFLAFATAHASETPIDVDQMLADMIYLGTGKGGNAHKTLLSCTAALFNRGKTREVAVERCLAALALAAMRSGQSIDIAREQQKIGNLYDDWRDKAEARKSEETSKSPVDETGTIKPYQFPNEMNIPPWEWLYGRHLLRGEVACTAATGGTGKSTSSIVEALSMASGRALLDFDIPKPLRVVLINLEDTRNTMDKRIAAVMQYYELTPADIGDRLIVIGKGELKIKLARQLRSGDVKRDEAAIRALIELVHKHHGDVLSIDSLIRTHKVNENDNSAMQEVVECYEDVAQAAKCAVHLWHHNRKSGGEKVSMESVRGASALMDACRSGRVFETMTAKEHEQLSETHPDMQPPGFYFRAYNGKRNFAPPVEDSDWFELKSVLLANGDNLGVVTRWQYPGSRDPVPPEVAEHIFAELHRGLPDGQRFSNDNAAIRRAAWEVVHKHCPNKTKEQCRRQIKAWIDSGELYTDKYYNPVQYKEQTGLFVTHPPANETPQEGNSDDDCQGPATDDNHRAGRAGMVRLYALPRQDLFDR